MNMTSPNGKSDKRPQFYKIIWNWMITQYSINHSNLLVYQIREDDNTKSKIYINKMASQYTIFNVIPFTGDAYFSKNVGFWKVVHELTI